MLLHEAAEVIQVAHLVDRVAKGRETGYELGEVAARAGQPPPGQGCSIQPKFTLDELEEDPATLCHRRGPAPLAVLQQSAPLLEKSPGAGNTPARGPGAPARFA